MKKFNYAIGHYWDSKSEKIGTYNYFGEVQYGTKKDAKKLLKYVKSKCPEQEWKIFMLVELPE
jgi:hypothetical protein